MQKLFYLLFDSADADGTRMRESILRDAVPVIRSAGGVEVCVFASDQDVAAGAPVRNCDPPIRAMVSFWMEDVSERGPVEVALASIAGSPSAPPAGYIVAESRPLDHERPTGERTPGMKQITCITRRPDISPEEFVRIWHGDHERVALETQSTFGYVRNEIVRPLSPEAPDHWSAFVEESFPIEALDDPMVFFDAQTPEALRANVDRMLESCRRFLDLSALDVTFVSEYDLG